MGFTMNPSSIRTALRVSRERSCLAAARASAGAPLLDSNVHRRLLGDAGKNSARRNGEVAAQTKGARRYCVSCEQAIAPLDGVVRLEFGTVVYRKRGAVYRPYPDDYPRWIHGGCMARLELVFEQCHLCGQQFYQSETAVDLVVGNLDTSGKFLEQKALGRAHWACICWAGVPLDAEG